MKIKKINVLIVGFGYWGPILARNFQSNSSFNVHSICDSSSTNLKKAKNIYPNSNFYKSYKSALNNKDVNFVVVSTPTNTHYKIVKYSLLKKKNVLCEKPLSLNLQEVKKLISISKKNKNFLFVDYPFIYSESVRFIKKIFQNKKLGKPLIYESIREKAPYRKDSDVIWDLGIHDFAILKYLLKRGPKKYDAKCKRTLKNFKSDFANINLSYSNNFNAFIKLNWASPLKIRLIKIYFEKGLLVYDENEEIYKVSIYKKNKKGFNLETPLINFNETLKLFVDFIAKTLSEKIYSKFDHNFSLDLTRLISNITKNI